MQQGNGEWIRMKEKEKVMQVWDIQIRKAKGHGEAKAYLGLA